MDRMPTTPVRRLVLPADDSIAALPDERRRGLLKVPGLFALGSLAVLSLGESMPAWAQTQSGSTKDDIGILNVALGLEYQAIAAYQVGAESGLLQKPVLDTAVKFQTHHKAHAQVLASTVSKLGGSPVMAKKPSEYAFPTGQLKTQADVLRFAAGLEKGATAAYLACCRISITGISPRRRAASSATRPCTGRCCCRHWGKTRCRGRLSAECRC